ncbi:MAG: GDSL-type esterase/lipase family protein [Candidatus Bathyarchaeota archaeon]|nr:GDSL-type esterase/lipase family protein [Candidatus Bathyarchaeota archaeon]
MIPSLKWFAAALGTILLIASLAVLFFGTQSASASEVRVACVGDSITRDTEYPEALSEFLGANYTVKDFGVGRTTISLQFNKPYMSQQAFKDAQRFNPDIIIIMLGTNDAYLSPEQRANFVNDYKALIAAFQALPSNPKIYIVVPPPVFNNTLGLPASVLDNEVIPLVNQTASELRLPTIDVHTPLLDNSADFPDGVHPNVEASQEIASEIYNAIT